MGGKSSFLKSRQLEKMVHSHRKDRLNLTLAGVSVRREEEERKPEQGNQKEGVESSLLRGPHASPHGLRSASLPALERLKVGSASFQVSSWGS